MKETLQTLNWKETAIGLSLLAALAALAATASYSYLFFHTFAELFSIIIAYGVFMLAWNTRRFINNGYLLFVGTSYFFVAFLDLLHTLAYKGMPVFTGFDDNNLPPQIWIVARYMESLSLLIAPAFFTRRLSVPAAFAAFTGVTALALASIFLWRIFPDCFVDGQGLTPFKIVSEYVISIILCAAAYLLWVNRQRFDPIVLRYLMLSMAATIATELCFTAYTHLYAPINLVGHLFKILSFYFMYRAIIVTGLEHPYDLLFRDLQLEIEDRKKAEAELLKSRELLDKTQKAGGIGGFDWDYERARLFWTPESYRLFDAPSGFTPTMDALYERAADEDRLSLMEAFERCRETGENLDVEARIVTFSGQERWIRFRGAPASSGGRTTLAGIVQDITDSKRLELLRDDIDRISKHDLKSPLGGIIGLTEVMQSATDMDAGERNECLSLIRQSGHKMLSLINTSLGLFKMEQGTYPFEPGPVDLLAVVRQTEKEMRKSLDARALKLTVSVQGRPAREGDVFPVLGEEPLCWTMLGNLLANAAEASPEGGGIEIRLERENGSGRMAIRNQGAVPEGIRQRFFQKYATEGKRGGTGLGAYSARLMAETQNGSIALDASEPGITTVIVTLPGV